MTVTSQFDLPDFFSDITEISVLGTLSETEIYVIPAKNSRLTELLPSLKKWSIMHYVADQYST